MSKKTISFSINGRKEELLVDVRKTLLEVIREDLELTGTKEGCAVGECGACTAIVNGMVVDTCIYLAVWADGKDIVTIEGLKDENGTLSDVQESFIESGAVQCGFCIPGMVLAATALLDKDPNPSRESIRHGMSGNLCRCTGYNKIVNAVEMTAAKR